MIGWLMEAAWLSILITIITRGYKVSWTDLLLWIAGIYLVGALVGYMIAQIAGQTVGGIAELIFYCGGIYYLVHDRYGIAEPKKLALLLFLFVSPSLILMIVLLMAGNGNTP